MKKVINQWLALTLAIGALVSCSEERNEPSSTAEGGGEIVTLSLSAEVSVDDADLRAINYKLGTNANGKVVPLPEFTDGQEVDVHTILKSNRSGYPVVAKTLKWRYNAASRSLVLSPTSKVVSQDVNNIVIANFNNLNGVKWYVSGLLGGTLDASTRKVSFEGVRELRGVEGNVGDIVGSLNVPYAFGWTEVTINTQDKANVREGNGSYRYAQIPSSAKVKFSPLGSLIAYKLGNDQREGAYTFTPSGFYVSSNVFFDKGTFDLNTAIPTSGDTQSVLPSWTEGALSNLVYSFASGQEPGVIDHKQVSGKTYYAWVMPNSTKPAVEVTRVVMKGESSRPETSTYRDYTKTWITDYSVKGTQLNHGRVYSLKANVTHTYSLPIGYVTDYNLAGGEGLTYTVPDASSYTYGHYDMPTSSFQLRTVAFPGTTGPLRFADSHSNFVSGYYNYDMLSGLYHPTRNPDAKNLQTEIDKVFGADKYFVPTIDQWWSIFPSHHETPFHDPNRIQINQNLRDEAVALGAGDDLIRQSYWSDYKADGQQVQYAIRFKARNNSKPMTVHADYDVNANKPIVYTYPSATDDSFKCAYRYTRVGSPYDWTYNQDYCQFIVDVVYLGEEVVPTTINDISDPAWWSAKKAENLVITKVFPLSNFIEYTPSEGKHFSYDRPVSSSYEYFSSSRYDASRLFTVSQSVSDLGGDHFFSLSTLSTIIAEDTYYKRHRAITVRLFERNSY